MKKILMLLSFFGYCNDLFAQSESCDNYCGFKKQTIDLNELRRFIANNPFNDTQISQQKVGQRIVNNILCAVGAQNQKIIAVPYGGVPIALANECYDKDSIKQKYIIYNDVYLDELQTKQDSAVIYAIFAHEIAHHIIGEAWLGCKKNTHKTELAADNFAGFVLGALHFEESVIVGSLKNVEENESDTHPAKCKRVEQMIVGRKEGLKNAIIDEKIPYLMNCRPSNDSLYKIAYKYSDTSFSNYWTVNFWITGTTEDLKKIRKVIYYLHPTSFLDNIRVQEKGFFYKNNNFKERIMVYGEFELRAQIISDNDKIIVVQYLKNDNSVMMDEKPRTRPIKPNAKNSENGCIE